MGMQAAVSPVLWVIFGIVVVISLILDLGLHRGGRESSIKASAIWSVVWISLAVIFGLAVSPAVGSERTLNYFTAYLLEKSLSVDNLFVFIVIFSFFKVSPIQQRRVLFWGILGALIMRAIFIFLGVALLSRFHFLFYVFGGFLVYTGIKLLFGKNEEVHPEKSLAYRIVRKLFPITDSPDTEHFFVRENGHRMATRLFVVLVVIEATDVVFAVDSIPAVLAVTTDPFVVYTSNIFAILGLRALYFLLAGVMTQFRYLNVGLAFVLSFIGVKMIAAAIDEAYKLPPVVSLGVVGTLLGTAIVASLVADSREKRLAKQAAVVPVETKVEKTE